MKKDMKKNNDSYLEKFDFEVKMIILAITTLLSIYMFYFSGKIGMLSFLKHILLGVFGFSIFLIPIALSYYFYKTFKQRKFEVNLKKVLYYVLLSNVATMLISSIVNNNTKGAIEVFYEGFSNGSILCVGIIASSIANLIINIVGQGFAIIIFTILTCVVLAIAFDKKYEDLLQIAKNLYVKFLKTDNTDEYKELYNTKKIKLDDIKKRYKDYNEEISDDFEEDDEVEIDVIEKIEDTEKEKNVNIEEERVEDTEMEKVRRRPDVKKKVSKHREVDEALEGKFTTTGTRRRYNERNAPIRNRDFKPKRKPKFFKMEPRTEADTYIEAETESKNKIVFNPDIFKAKHEHINYLEYEDDIKYRRKEEISFKEIRQAIPVEIEDEGSFLHKYINAESATRWVKNGQRQFEEEVDELADSYVYNEEVKDKNIEETINQDIYKNYEQDEPVKSESQVSDEFKVKAAILDQVYNKVKKEIIAYYNDSSSDNFDYKKVKHNANVEDNKDDDVEHQEHIDNQTQEPNFRIIGHDDRQVDKNSYDDVKNNITLFEEGKIEKLNQQPDLEKVNNINSTRGNDENTSIGNIDLSNIRAQNQKSSFEDIAEEITDELKEEIKGEVKEKLIKEFADRIIENMSDEDKEEFLITLESEQSKVKNTNRESSNTAKDRTYEHNIQKHTERITPTVNINEHIRKMESITVEPKPEVVQKIHQPIHKPMQEVEQHRVEKPTFVQQAMPSIASDFDKIKYQSADKQEERRNIENVQKNNHNYIDVNQKLDYNNNIDVENNNDDVMDEFEREYYELLRQEELAKQSEYAQQQNEVEYDELYIEDIYDDEDLDEIEQEYMEMAQTAEPKKQGLTHINTVATRNKPYEYPSVDILAKNDMPSTKMTDEEIKANSEKLEETLQSFGVKAKVLNVTQGPTVTRYEVQPGVGVKVSKIVNLTDDLALNLAAQGIRIQAPIPGKSAVGIEVPNKERETIFYREILENDKFLEHESKIAITLGKDIAGKVVVGDIAKMPHLLVAGATGSGKSVCINTIITSILYRAKPEECKLLMIDPKVVELSIYNGIPHLMIPVVTDPKKASSALQWAVSEMEKRYEYFAESSVRDLKGYNNYVKENNLGEELPQVVIIVDELADLMMTAGKDVEDSICRLAQKARAAGIYLIIATQRPSVDVITGLIKANIPSRIAFSVTSSIDSRTILDSVGAEKLLGRGDMLFSPYGSNNPIRVQGAFISDKEVENIVKHLKETNVVTYDENIVNQITSGQTIQGIPESEADDLLNEAMLFFIEKDKASVSMLQTRFKIGYNRAARIVDTLEGAGYIGQQDGSKGRKILISKDEWEEMNS